MFDVMAKVFVCKFVTYQVYPHSNAREWDEIPKQNHGMANNSRIRK